MRRSCLALSLLATPLAAQRPDHADHPLLTRYSGSTAVDKTVEEFGRYQLVTGVNERYEFQGRTLEGKLTRFVYQNPAERSTLEIFRNYRTALGRAGLQELFNCELDACGPAYARSAWGRHNNLFVAADGDPRYLAGTIRTAGGTTYVAVMVGRRRTQVDIIEIVAMQGDMVVADAASLLRELDANGRVTVNGIYFDVDQSELKPESRAAIEQVASLLRANAGLRLFVVGHTDITGDLQHNRTLSEARARAVVASLVRDYGIAASRLDGYGVGPLAPVGTNASETGRALNRRVELVRR